MHMHPVTTGKDLAAFLDLPYRLYQHDPVWVPPLRDEQRGQFDPRRNPLLNHCEWQLFLLEDRGKFIGRTAAFLDNLGKIYALYTGCFVVFVIILAASEAAIALAIVLQVYKGHRSIMTDDLKALKN